MRNPPRKLELFYCVLVPYSWLSFEATFLRGGGKGDIEHEDIIESQSIQTAAEKAKFSEEHTKYLLEKCSTKEAFGLPTVVFHMHDKSHMFFGSDRMELLTHLLGEQWQGPVPNIMKGKLSAID